MGKNNPFNKKIKFFGARYTASNVFWWIGFFIVIWLEYKGKNLNNVQNTIYYSIVFVLIIAGVVFKELQRHTAGEDTNKAMKSLTKAYIGIWGAWAIVDVWYTIWGIYLQHDVLIPYLVITLVALLAISGISLARRSTFPE